jgi:hypothetical protein
MKNTPLDLTLFSKAHFAMNNTEESSQDPTPFFFHATSSPSFPPPQDAPKGTHFTETSNKVAPLTDLSSLYKPYHPAESSSTSTSEGTPTFHAYDDPFMSMFVDPTTHHEAEFETPETPINANRRRRRSTTKGKAACKESTPTSSPRSEDAESDSDPFAILKRRRNTEASARFRVKKKMREQALRRTADETTLRSQQLQHRVNELEKEIKWLRELIVEKKKKDDRH